MASLSSASTDAEVWAAYDDNASYDEDGSASKAAAFITACRILIRRLPKMATHGGGRSITTTVSEIRAELRDATAWANTNPAALNNTGGATFADFGGLR